MHKSDDQAVMVQAPAIGRIGFRAGIAAATATIAYDVVQILQVVGVLTFPLDEILIYGTSLCIVVPFVFEILALHYSSSSENRLWTHAAVVFTTMYAVFGTANYVVQLATVVPAKMNGTIGTMSVLEQTPHSLFWDFDAIAYIMMGVTALAIIPALGISRVERRLRLAAIAHVIATGLSCIVYFYPTYSYKLLMVGFPWAITAPVFMLFLASVLRTRGAETARASDFAAR